MTAEETNDNQKLYIITERKLISILTDFMTTKQADFAPYATSPQHCVREWIKDREIAENLEEYANQKTEAEWISVKKQLPYKDGNSSIDCLVYDTYFGIVVRPYNEYHTCWDGEDGDDYYTDAVGGKITHWMPLPEPPKN